MKDIENIIANESMTEFRKLPLDIQMKLLSGQIVKDNNGNIYKLEMCLEGLHYKQDGTVEIIKGR